MKLLRPLAFTASAAAGLAGLYLGLVTGAVTVNLGIGRRTRPLGPLTLEIKAPRALVFEVAAAPYAERPARAMKEKVTVLERGQGMVLASHRTKLPPHLGRELAAITTETVTLTPPSQMGFRLLRGPVPDVTETFEFTEINDEATRFVYTGELGTDLWSIGEKWGDLVTETWIATVKTSMRNIAAEAERRHRT